MNWLPPLPSLFVILGSLSLWVLCDWQPALWLPGRALLINTDRLIIASAKTPLTPRKSQPVPSSALCHGRELGMGKSLIHIWPRAELVEQQKEGLWNVGGQGRDRRADLCSDPSLLFRQIPSPSTLIPRLKRGQFSSRDFYTCSGELMYGKCPREKSFNISHVL